MVQNWYDSFEAFGITNYWSIQEAYEGYGRPFKRATRSGAQHPRLPCDRGTPAPRLPVTLPPQELLRGRGRAGNHTVAPIKSVAYNCLTHTLRSG